MLKNIEPAKVPIILCGKEMYLRYTLLSQLYFEHYYPDAEGGFLDKSTEDMTTLDTIHMLRAGLIDCFFEENEDAISRRDFDAVKPSLAGVGRMVDTVGARDIVAVIVEAIITSLPPPMEGRSANFQNGAH